MAIAATQVWEVRTTGSDTFGGGFDSGVTSPGTDYSQQTTARVVFDGVTIAAHAAGVTATIILTGYTVATADVGNTVQITGGTGFTAGFYTITAVSVGSVTWTLDRNCTSGVASGMVGNMGGALATIGKATGVAVGSNTIWVKATATYTITTTIGFGYAVNLTPSFLIGYTTTRGDNGQATVACSTNSVHFITVPGNAENSTIKNFRFVCTAGTPGDGIHTGGQTYGTAIVNCYFSGCHYGINGSNSSAGFFTGILIDSCEITTCTADGFINAQYAWIVGCYIHGNTGCGVNLNTNGMYTTIIDSVISANAGTANILYSAPNQAATLFILGCAIIGATHDGIQFSASSTIELQLLVWNCIIDSNGGYGINATTGTSIAWGPSFRNNAWGSVGTANASGDIFGTALPKDSADVTLTGDPFTSRSGNNFTLNNTAGAGALCRAAGYPGALPWGTSNTGYRDIGPLQHQDAGGAAGMLYVPTMEGL